MDDYLITAKEEVLREVGSTIISDILRYMIDNNIKTNDIKNPISILYKKIFDLNDSLIRNIYHTTEELDNVLAQFSFAKEYFGEIENG